MLTCQRDETYGFIADELTVPVFASQADVSRPEDVLRFVEATMQRFGGIDVFVNNAGIWAASLPDDPIDKSPGDYEKLVGTNLRGVFLFGPARHRTEPSLDRNK